MASMIFASSPLSAQSFVKLRTNSNYSHSPCYISRAKKSYIHLPYKNISHIESSKSLFIKGDGNLSFSSPKFPRVASTYSPSLKIIKACTGNQNVYHFYAHDLEKGKDIELGDRYRGEILLIVNLPQKSSESAKVEIEFLNDLRDLYRGKTSSYGKGFEVLGFFPYMKESIWPWRREDKGNPKLAHGEEEIYKLAHFPIFRKVSANDNDDKNVWNFMRKSKTNGRMEKEFEKFLVDGTGEPTRHFIWFTGETLKPKIVKPGEYPGEEFRYSELFNPTSLIKDAIDEYFR